VLALGERCGLHRIERLMRAQALRARPRRRGMPKDHGEAAPLRPTCWTANSRLTHRTRSGWRTSPTSGRPRAGCTWRWCWTCTRAGRWAGQCNRAWPRSWWPMRWWWPCGDVGDRCSCSIIRTRAAKVNSTGRRNTGLSDRY